MKDARQPFPDSEADRTKFDMIVTFRQETQAREAMAELRVSGFSPEQAVLLFPDKPAESSDPLALDGYLRFSPEQLVADRTIAILIILCTEFAVGALAGAAIGWLVGLFLNAPDIGPVWIWMLILGAAGGGIGLAIGSLEWKRWKRQLEELRHQVAIGMRFTGRHPATAVIRARAILERHGGSGIDNT